MVPLTELTELFTTPGLSAFGKGQRSRTDRNRNVKGATS
jgi:hypothetical protein